jgi:hypothetical protein
MHAHKCCPQHAHQRLEEQDTSMHIIATHMLRRTSHPGLAQHARSSGGQWHSCRGQHARHAQPPCVCAKQARQPHMSTMPLSAKHIGSRCLGPQACILLQHILEMVELHTVTNCLAHCPELQHTLGVSGAQHRSMLTNKARREHSQVLRSRQQAALRCVGCTPARNTGLLHILTNQLQACLCPTAGAIQAEWHLLLLQTQPNGFAQWLKHKAEHGQLVQGGATAQQLKT